MNQLVPEYEGWVVDNVPGTRSRKAYTCPGCGNLIRAGEAHIVAWPDGEVAERRHWHRHCWRLAVRRGRL